MTRRLPVLTLTAALLLSVSCSSDDATSPSSAEPAATRTVPRAATSPDTTSTDVPSTAATTATVDDDDVDATDSSTSDRVDATDSTVVSATGVAPTTVVEPRPGDGPLSIDELLALGRPIVLSHAGGEDVHPHSTPFAYAESVDAGVDMLDLDVQLTSDGVVVVHHDDTVDRTTDGTGRVSEMTYAELLALDNAHWFTATCVCTGRADEEYVHRGVRTGEKAPPTGYTPDDFVIPRLRDIVTRFPSMPLNIEIKARGAAGIATAEVLAAELAELDRLENAVVTSFEDDVNDAFRELAPGVDISPGLGAASDWVLSGDALTDAMRILQLPPDFEGVDVLTPEVIAASEEAGYPIWVWPNDRAWENRTGYELLLAMGVSGLNANDPSAAVAAVNDRVAEVEDEPAPAELLAAARAGVEESLTAGDGVGDCPYGSPAALVAALPDSLPLAAAFDVEGVENNGQVFVGGDVDITYCQLTPDAGGEGPIDEIRVDVSPSSRVDVQTYLDEEFTTDEVSTHDAGTLLGADLRAACWDEFEMCGAFWQSGELFVAVVLRGQQTQKLPHAVTTAHVLVPLVLDGLAASAT